MNRLMILFVVIALFILSINLVSESLAASASIRADGTLLIDGKAVFPIGIRIEGDGKEHNMIAKAGFNMLLGSGAVKPSYYVQAQKNGLFVIAGHYIWATFRGAKGRGIDLYSADKQAIAKTMTYRNQSGQTPLEAIKATRKYPCIFAWNTCEEPYAKFIEPLEIMYEIFKSHNPHHLVIPLTADVGWAHIFRNASDVIMVDCYPYRGKESQPEIYTYQFIRRAQEGIGDKPVWLMSQLYPPAYWTRNNKDELTLQQMRQQHYLGLIAGAKGVVMYSFPSLQWYWRDGKRMNGSLNSPRFEKRWANVKKMVAELQKLGPIICDGKPIKFPLQWFCRGKAVPGPKIRILDYYGDLYMLVANIADYSETAKVINPHRFNRNAYNIQVWLGKGGLDVIQAKGKSPAKIMIHNKSQGVFLLKRKPMRNSR